MNPKKNIRERLVGWHRHRLFMPRFQMILILSLTGFGGFISSFLLLRAGIEQMWMRYPLAILSAYVAFLLTLRLWLALHLSQGTWNLGGNPNSPSRDAAGSEMDFDLPVSTVSGATDPPNPAFSFGGGGDFGGAGAGGSWGEALPDSAAISSSSGGSDSDSSEFALVILAAVAIIGGLLASLYIVYIAPVLLAEILVDGFLVSGLYKRVEHIERKHWLQTAIWKTLLPALLCAVLFGVAGMALQIAAPDAKSIGEVWRELKTSKTAN